MDGLWTKSLDNVGQITMINWRYRGAGCYRWNLYTQMSSA